MAVQNSVVLIWDILLLLAQQQQSCQQNTGWFPILQYGNVYFWSLIWIIQVFPSGLISNCSYAEQMLHFCIHHLQHLGLVALINSKIISLLLTYMNF